MIHYPKKLADHEANALEVLDDLVAFRESSASELDGAIAKARKAKETLVDCQHVGDDICAPCFNSAEELLDSALDALDTLAAELAS